MSPGTVPSAATQPHLLSLVQVLFHSLRCPSNHLPSPHTLSTPPSLEQITSVQTSLKKWEQLEENFHRLPPTPVPKLLTYQPLHPNILLSHLFESMNYLCSHCLKPVLHLRTRFYFFFSPLQKILAPATLPSFVQIIILPPQITSFP